MLPLSSASTYNEWAWSVNETAEQNGNVDFKIRAYLLHTLSHDSVWFHDTHHAFNNRVEWLPSRARKHSLRKGKLCIRNRRKTGNGKECTFFLMKHGNWYKKGRKIMIAHVLKGIRIAKSITIIYYYIVVFDLCTMITHVLKENWYYKNELLSFD